MSISKHIHSLQQHLARLGLQRVQVDGPNNNDQSEIFKVCFLNKYETEPDKLLAHRAVLMRGSMRPIEETDINE